MMSIIFLALAFNVVHGIVITIAWPKSPNGYDKAGSSVGDILQFDFSGNEYNVYLLPTCERTNWDGQTVSCPEDSEPKGTLIGNNGPVNYTIPEDAEDNEFLCFACLTKDENNETHCKSKKMGFIVETHYKKCPFDDIQISSGVTASGYGCEAGKLVNGDGASYCQFVDSLNDKRCTSKCEKGTWSITNPCADPTETSTTTPTSPTSPSGSYSLSPASIVMVTGGLSHLYSIML